ncbi:MAG: PilZ domain-containing protein [Candidatus Tectomicrobia bacterium]|nr:PilZ domain-containing protein [Candidatus Tectomicrobia bacterium]
MIPETAPHPLLADSPEQRRFFRADLLLPLVLSSVAEGGEEYVSLGKPTWSRCLNVSGNGVVLVSPKRHQPGDYLFLRIRVPDREHLVCAVAEVIRLKQDPARGGEGWHLACAFRLIKQAEQDLLVKYILHETLEQALENSIDAARDASAVAASPAAGLR